MTVTTSYSATRLSRARGIRGFPPHPHGWLGFPSDLEKERRMDFKKSGENKSAKKCNPFFSFLALYEKMHT